MPTAVKSKPLLGGVFNGRYSLASVPCVDRGLHSVRFFVLDAHGGAVLAVADQKADALSSARRLLRATALLVGYSDVEPEPQQGLLFPDADPLTIEEVGTALRPVSRRRRQVFERCAGSCHYCGERLQLDGAWHADHAHPRALGGTDDIINLVAACARCNLAKRDRTALEYVARQGDP